MIFTLLFISIDLIKPNKVEACHNIFDDITGYKHSSFEKLKCLINEYPDPEAQELLSYRYRLAQINWNSVSCVLSIFCATMICTFNYKHSIGKIIILSLTGAVFFYILRTTCDSFGENGIAPPLLTAGIPYLGIVGLVVIFHLYRRSKWSLKP